MPNPILKDPSDQVPTTCDVLLTLTPPAGVERSTAASGEHLGVGADLQPDTSGRATFRPRQLIEPGQRHVEALGARTIPRHPRWHFGDVARRHFA